MKTKDLPINDMLKLDIPSEVLQVNSVLKKAGYEVYIVGGCVRDLLMSVHSKKHHAPNDWDLGTNAKPEKIQELFPDHVYENTFGTVGIKTKSENPALKVIEVTTFRVESSYKDSRHPDSVSFVSNIEEDLARRDFTVNAMALAVMGDNEYASGATSLSVHCKIIDPFNGLKDLQSSVLRAVGNARERFEEDALRLFRAVRFSVQLGFALESETAAAAKALAAHLRLVAAERIRIEFEKMIMSAGAADGVVLLEQLGLLQFVMPELREGIKCNQNQHHIYTVFEHLIRSLDYAVKKNSPLHIRLSVLLHDVGKPRTKRGAGKFATFYSHEIVGARMTRKILERLKFPSEVIEKTVHLVRYHMFYYNVGEVSAAGVRRFLMRIGVENVDDFLTVREADRIGSGVPKAAPYKLRHLRFMIEKVRHDPVSPKMLVLRGDDVMRVLNIPPGPRVGMVLNALLEEVLDDPQKNSKSYLESRIVSLGELTEKNLAQLAQKAREKKEEFNSMEETEMKKKYFIL